MTLNPNFLDSYPITQSFFIINLCCFTRAALLNGHDGQALLAGLRNSPVSSWNTPWSSRSAKPWRAETSHKKIWGNHSKMLGKWGNPWFYSLSMLRLLKAKNPGSLNASCSSKPRLVTRGWWDWRTTDNWEKIHEHTCFTVDIHSSPHGFNH